MFCPQLYPKAIIHIDADAFFAGCEQSLHPELRGKPLVCGEERGIAIAISYEAKVCGITRGMPINEIRQKFPHVIIRASDYEIYSLFSKRMFAIIRRYVGLLEEYSIDECFAEITGLKQSMRMSYGNIALRIQSDIQKELNISVSVGVAPTKVLAKIASSLLKPHSVVCIPGKVIERVLKRVPISAVWGIGKNTSARCAQLKLFTALNFALCDEKYIAANFLKPIQEIHKEIRGISVYPVVTEEKTKFFSISKTHTFTPTTNKASVWTELVSNVESACNRGRRFGLAPREIMIMLKTNDFITNGLKVRITRATNFPIELLSFVRPLFDSLWKDGIRYRSSGIVLMDLVEHTHLQMTLFEEPVRFEKIQRVYEAVDSLYKKLGQHAVHSAASLNVHNKKPLFLRTINAISGVFGVLKKTISTPHYPTISGIVI